MNEELQNLIGDAPEVATVGWVADRFGVASGTVLYAIRTNKLPATPVTDAFGAVLAYSISPMDAALIWGYRLRDRVTAAAK